MQLTRYFVKALFTIRKLSHGREKNIDSRSDLLVLKPGKAYQINFLAKDEALHTVVYYLRNLFNPTHV